MVNAGNAPQELIKMLKEYVKKCLTLVMNIPRKLESVRLAIKGSSLSGGNVFLLNLSRLMQLRAFTLTTHFVANGEIPNALNVLLVLT